MCVCVRVSDVEETIVLLYRQLLFAHRQSLLGKVEHEEDPAMSLHLVVVLLFQQHTGCMVHAPGRMVPSMVAILEKYLPEEEQKILLSFQQLIIKYITAVRNKEETKLNNEPQNSNTDSKPDDVNKAEDTEEDKECEEDKNDESTAEAEQMDNDPTALLSKLNDDLKLVKGIVLKPKKQQ